MTGALVNEMDPRAVDLRREIRAPVQGSFGRAPVKVVCPVGDERAKEGCVGAQIPRLSWCGDRPAGGSQPRAQVVQNLVRHGDAKRRDR
jgi:hypothetical protein